MSDLRFHSLSFLLRHAGDMDALTLHGPGTPQGVLDEDWAAFNAVLNAAREQRTSILRSCTEALLQTLSAAAMRVEPVTREATRATGWESFGAIYAPRARKPLASLGVAIGIDLDLPTSLLVWWGHRTDRGLSGPRLAERLRAAGEKGARSASGKDGWRRGTVILAALDLQEPRTIDECQSFAIQAAGLVARHRKLFELQKPM